MTNQPDYNDGKWHGWNGGECPVHPESEIEASMLDITNECRPLDPYSSLAIKAGVVPKGCWMHGDTYRHVIAFRVTNPYVELRKPREFWVNVYEDGRIGGMLHETKDDARRIGQSKATQFKVREVIEE